MRVSNLPLKFNNKAIDFCANIVFLVSLFQAGLNREPNDLSSWLALISGMSLAIFLLVLAILFLIASALYIPLPYELCDRQKVQFFEFGLRLSNEYLVCFNQWSIKERKTIY